MGDGLGSYYSLTNRTKDQELIAGSGRAVKEIFDYLNSLDDGEAHVSIFEEWDYYGYSYTPDEQKIFSAKTVAADMSRLILYLSQLDPDRRFGGLTASEWIDWFKSVHKHADAHPDDEFTSGFYE